MFCIILDSPMFINSELEQMFKLIGKLQQFSCINMFYNLLQIFHCNPSRISPATGVTTVNVRAGAIRIVTRSHRIVLYPVYWYTHSDHVLFLSFEGMFLSY